MAEARKGRAPSEHTLQQLILAQSALLEGVWLYRANTGAATTATGRVVRFGLRGQADITGLVRGGIRVEIEVKSERGRLTAEQRAYGERILSLDGAYIVAQDLEYPLTVLRDLVHVAGGVVGIAGIVGRLSDALRRLW